MFFFFLKSLRLSDYKVLHNIASSSSFLDFVRIFSLFSLVFRTSKFLEFKEFNKTIGLFTVVCSATEPMNGSEAAGDLALIQPPLLLSCKLCCCNAN